MHSSLLRSIKFYSLFLFCGVTMFNSCSCERPPDVSHVKVEFELEPFYDDLFSKDPDSLENYLDFFMEKYGSFFDAYGAGIIGAGYPDQEGFVTNMQMFIEYEYNEEVVDSVRSVYDDISWLYSDLEKAFKYYKYYFSENDIPDVYMHISGFNQSVVIDSSWVSVSIEKYLGAECPFYEWLEIPVYLRRGMIPEKVVPDIMKSIAMSQFPKNDSIDDLVSNMIYEGKILYFTKQMVPEIADSLLFNYSSKQTGWVESYEREMWSTIVERDHLFSTDRMTIRRYIGESPFTYYFGQDSPGRTGHYLGYKIVESYMSRNSEISLKEMMQIEDTHIFFRNSGYRP
ncbi:DUF2268 domain-containing putative Zn-dependent protease [Marinilabiliaceae bacterium ANBcel2]|nr:DUF2268 domain-containing putative Zn-dependent protease [Marinilabiliaceae bacterium ANBcel2]